MKDESSSQLFDRIYSISKEIIQIEFPKEKDFFEPIWKVMTEYISIWQEKMPSVWQSHEYQGKLIEELGFLDEADVSEINTPKVIALISLVWLRLAEFKGRVQDADIEETITKYGKSLPEWLRLKTVKLAVPMIKSDLIKAGRIASVAEDEEKKYVMYSHEDKKGRDIFESELEKYSEDKESYFIWLDEKNQDLLINGKRPSHVYPEERRALACLIKNAGQIAKYKELYLAIHNIGSTPENSWPKNIEFMNDIHKCKSKLLEHCPELRRFITTISNQGYMALFPKELKYCLVMELPEKIT